MATFSLKNILQEVTSSDLKPISGMDAAFLYAEAPNSPMHVGSLTILEGAMSFEDFKKIIASRLPLLPKFRQRLVSVPFNLDYPYWADDPNFDLDMHLHHIALPEPGNWKALRDMSSRVFSGHLDHARPLWSITFVEGLDNVSQVPPGSVAILTNIHHVMIDGVSGLGVMGILYDRSAENQMNKLAKPIPFKPAPLPNDLSLLLKSYGNFMSNPFKLPVAVGQTVWKVVKTQVTPQLANKELPKASFTAPKTIFNENVSLKRTWGSAILELERVKTLKNIMGVTLNDIILTICSGAIRKYLLEKNKLPAQPLVANVPVSTRTTEDSGELNNQISNMLIPIATHVEEPIERLELIHEYTSLGKVRHRAMGAKTIAKMADSVPFGLANLAAGIYSRYNLSQLHRPIFNVTITNVPGPQDPLYMNGHKVLSVMGMGPVIDGQGLIIAILSYAGQITISSTSDVSTIPDIDLFSRYIRETANELENIILEKEKKRVEELEKNQADDIFDNLKKSFGGNPEMTADAKGLFQIYITGRKSSNWQINLNRNPAIVKQGIYSSPDVILTVSEPHLRRIVQGEISWEEAEIQGRIKVQGDRAKFAALSDLLVKKPQPEAEAKH